MLLASEQKKKYEALIAETMVWPNFFLMNVFFALKGSKLFIINNTAVSPRLLQLNYLFLFD